jgi:MFS family permease
MGCIFLALAIAAIPAGYWAVRLGNRRAMVIGLVGMVLVCGALGAVKQTFWAVALAIFLGIAFSLVANGTIPFALSMVPEFKAGLGTGMYFGGAAAALAVFGAIFGTELRTPVAIGSAIAALSLLLAGGCVMSASRSSHSNL